MTRWDVDVMQDWRFDRLTRGQLAATAADSTVVLPLGSTEQHGHHLPVSVDATVVSALTERAVRRASRDVPVLLAPTLPFGFAHHHIQFGGTISLGPLSYVAVLTDIATSLAQQGFRRLVFLNGHGGNEAAMRLVADRVNYDVGLDLHVAATSYWTLAAEVLERVDLPSALVPGHAGHFETSLMLALDPDLVRLDQRPDDSPGATPIGTADLDGAMIRRPDLWAASDGYTDDAGLASAELGARALDDIAETIAEFLISFHRSV